MSLFDDVLEKTVRIVGAATFAKDLESATVIRDLKGRVRLLLEFPPNKKKPADWSTAREMLEVELGRELGRYWGERIWPPDHRNDRVWQALQKTVSGERKPWDTTEIQGSGNVRWFKLERTFSKSSWRSTSTPAVWDLKSEPDSPAIVTFYSFKGGVGRTTAAAAVALLLARAGRRVVALDLDIEAPGLGGLLLNGITPPDDGVVDYLLETQLVGKRPENIDAYFSAQSDTDLIEEGEPIRIMTAGKLNASFLEKTARLDFKGFVSADPNPLIDLLKAIREQYSPDFIFLDVRSGFHDLGGFSLNEMSHLDVLFGLDTPQSWAGLELIIPILAHSRAQRGVLLVHSLVTPQKIDNDANKRFRERSFDLLKRSYYNIQDDMPDIDTGPYGLPIPYHDDLLNLSSLKHAADRFIQPGSPYRLLAHAIGTYLERDTI